jgi:hypothetical protein
MFCHAPKWLYGGFHKDNCALKRKKESVSAFTLEEEVN